MTKLKICGITRVEDAQFCADHGVDFLGFIFVPESPRFIEPERAAEIASRGRGPKFVGVFRDAAPELVRQIATTAQLDLVQLHGAESDDDIREIGVPAVKALRVGDTLPDTTSAPSAQWLLFDTYDERRGGGTGRQFDWSLLALYPRTQPFFLSGGLGPESVAAAISLVHPDAIDVSSGVEASPGVKDHDKLRNLFDRIRRS
jgi:phosphoribosylanthranilate isomerase